ncbi:hypothetical protein [Vibrio owensii]|uniref:hypothetical protein n=1 Tax=Vibrio owensii TaxID=696485 RepID=UPI0005867270|nr:hypothetical protein [Vibrio owensii]
MKNKWAMVAFSIVLGSLIGSLVAYLTSMGPKGTFHSISAAIVEVPNKEECVLETPRVELQLGGGQQYEVHYYMPEDELGFTALGKYEYVGSRLSLQPLYHEKLLPERVLTFREKIMVANGTLLSNDKLCVIKVSKDEFLLVTPYRIIQFCTELGCK